MSSKHLNIKFRILNKGWTLRVLTKPYYKKKHGKDSVAVTLLHKRRIDLSPYGFDLETIVHELSHAYRYELCTHSADLTAHDIEEVFAEILAKRGRELLDLADRLFASVQDLTT